MKKWNKIINLNVLKLLFKKCIKKKTAHHHPQYFCNRDHLPKHKEQITENSNYFIFDSRL